MLLAWTSKFGPRARERFVAFARPNGCQCRVTFRDNQLTFDVPLARDFTEVRRIALDVIARFSAENTRADVRECRGLSHEGEA
jgi:hypothetical protein